MNDKVVDMNHYQSAGGGGTGGGGVEPRVARLEADVSGIKTNVSDIRADVRNIINLAIGACVLVVGMIVSSYLLLDGSVDAVQKTVNEIRLSLK